MLLRTTIILFLFLISRDLRADEHAHRRASAVAIAEKSLRPNDVDGLTGRLVSLADAQLRTGDVADAIKHYERVIELDPQSRPYLWQYGIALFFAERFEEGRELFVEHRRVNPNDVENAAWHFLCAAKATDLKSARGILLPAPGDRRAPMSQILQRLPGGDWKAIEAAVGTIQDPYRKESARFYADLYEGLIADAEGDSAFAIRMMAKAANTSLTHYMADVARVYHDHLKDAQSSVSK